MLSMAELLIRVVRRTGRAPAHAAEMVYPACALTGAVVFPESLACGLAQDVSGF